MAGLSAAAARDWLRKEFGGVDYTPTPTHDVCLYSVAPNSNGVGGTELSGFGYAPVTVDNDGVTWDDPGSIKRVTNLIVINFPQAVGGNWASAVAVVIKDDGGDVRGMGVLDPAFVVRDGQIRGFDPGELIIQAV